MAGEGGGGAGWGGALVQLGFGIAEAVSGGGHGGWGASAIGRGGLHVGSVTPGQASSYLYGQTAPPPAAPPPSTPQQSVYSTVFGQATHQVGGYIDAAKRGMQRGIELLQLYNLFRLLLSGRVPGQVPTQAPIRSTIILRSPSAGTAVPAATGGTPVAYDLLSGLVGTSASGGMLPTLYGGAENALGGLLGLGLGAASIYQAFKEPTYTAPSTGLFNIPGYDIQSPIVSEATTAKQDACSRLMSPWRGAASSTIRPKPFMTLNPVSGKEQWFVPARPSGWKVAKSYGGRGSGRRCRCRKR